MTYQKSFLHLLAVTMVFSLGALFSACGSDDDKNEIDNGKGSASDIIGTWGLVLKEYKIPNEQGGTNQSTTVYDYLNPNWSSPWHQQIAESHTSPCASTSMITAERYGRSPVKMRLL